MSRLTCDLQRGIAADGLAQVIPRYAHIHSFIRLAASSVNDSEEEREPLGRSMRWERGSSRSVSTLSPSLYHSTIGVGRPSALQFNVAGSPLETMRSEGCSTTLGAASSNLGRDPIRERIGGHYLHYMRLREFGIKTTAITECLN